MYVCVCVCVCVCVVGARKQFCSALFGRASVNIFHNRNERETSRSHTLAAVDLEHIDAAEIPHSAPHQLQQPEAGHCLHLLGCERACAFARAGTLTSKSTVRARLASLFCAAPHVAAHRLCSQKAKQGLTDRTQTGEQRPIPIIQISSADPPPVARTITTAPRVLPTDPKAQWHARAKSVEERADARYNGTEPNPLNGWERARDRDRESERETHTHTADVRGPLGRLKAKWRKRARSELWRIRCEDYR